MILTVPELESKPWPTLGPQVCQFIEENLVFGPGDLRGQPAVLDDEKRGLIYRMYEVYPKTHTLAGRRRFKRCALSLRKGSAKTELAAWIAICELHPDGPVRCGGFDRRGNPLGIGVSDPYIPLVAYTEEQSEELAFGTLRVVLENSVLASDFDIGLERVMRKAGDGKCLPVASSPSGTDGARTTFQVFDESHRMSRPRLKQAHRTMLANIPKRRGADAWTLETTTAPAPGEGSIAEDTMHYAQQVADGEIKDAKLFFFHRQASDGHDLTKIKGIRAAVREASGPVASWSDLDAIVEQWKDPTADKSYLERVWLNRLVQSSERAFDLTIWRALAKPEHVVRKRAKITLGFDGSRYRDATSLVGTEILTGFQFVLGLWEKPDNAKKWEVPKDEVDAAVDAAFRDYDVWRMYADPPYWEETVATWSGKYGEERVVAWWTNRLKPMAFAVRAFKNAIVDRSITHSGDPRYTRHLGNAFKKNIHMRDDHDQPLYVIQKERKDSGNKIDAAMAGILSWDARSHALALGLAKAQPQRRGARIWTPEGFKDANEVGHGAPA